MSALTPVARLGGLAIELCDELGGMMVLLARVLLALVPPALDPRELWRNLYKMGVKSLPIVVLTAVFTGGIMVIQAAMYVRRFNAYSMVGWGTGFSVFREVGPILIGLMFSGRVGSNNTAEDERLRSSSSRSLRGTRFWSRMKRPRRNSSDTPAAPASSTLPWRKKRSIFVGPRLIVRMPVCDWSCRSCSTCASGTTRTSPPSTLSSVAWNTGIAVCSSPSSPSSVLSSRAAST